MIRHDLRDVASTVLVNLCFLYRPVWLTSHYELLAVYSRVSFRFLQKADPVVHFLRCVSVAMDHTISSDNNKWVWPEEKKSYEYSTDQYNINTILKILFKKKCSKLIN